MFTTPARHLLGKRTFADEDCAGACCANQLPARTGPQLNVMDGLANGDIDERQRAARPDGCCRTRLHSVANFERGRRQDV